MELMSWLRNPPHNSQLTPLKKSPLPLFAKEGLKPCRKNSPFEKGGTEGGFEFELSRYRLEFLNEL